MRPLQNLIGHDETEEENLRASSNTSQKKKTKKNLIR
jgi:hypothetical protein